MRVAIWGVGLIGGSLGMAWRRSGLADEVIGIDIAPLDEAVALGAIDRAAASPEAGITEADLLVLAAPVGAIIAQAESHGHLIRPGTVVTDAGSTKQEVVRAWERFLPEGASFVGGHPMFGREVSGVAGASADLVAGCNYLLTPGERSTPEAVALVSHLAQAAGATVELLSPAEHDARVAFASHLPQAVATALAATALDADERLGGVLKLAAGGFRDTTRLAASPAAVWTDILLTNADAVRAALLTFRESLDSLERALDQEDRAAIARIFDRAHGARRKLS